MQWHCSPRSYSHRVYILKTPKSYQILSIRYFLTIYGVEGVVGAKPELKAVAEEAGKSWGGSSLS